MCGHTCKVAKERKRAREKERKSKRARRYYPDEFTRGINYVRSVEANIITDVLEFLTGAANRVASSGFARALISAGVEKCDKAPTAVSPGRAIPAINRIY